jgi:hypothetical protein
MVALPSGSRLLDEVLDFLASTPSLEAIIAFHPSEKTQERLRYLLDQNKAGAMTSADRAELEEFSRLNHFVTLLKARARKRLNQE